MIMKQYLIEKVDDGDGIIPLSRYVIKVNTGGENVQSFDPISDAKYMMEAVKEVLFKHASTGYKKRELIKAEITIYMERENGKS